MPRAKGNAASAAVKPAEPVKPVEPEQVDLDDVEEEEEVEYEEIEEEIEEEVEEEVEEDEEIENEENEDVNGHDNMKVDTEKDSDDAKHAELLALPPHGSEVYVGSISVDTSEVDLKAFFQSVGEVTESRIMKAKDSNENKGYAFVAFRTKELAAKAIEKCNNAILKGRKIKVSNSQAKNKLFIGNVPKDWSEDDLKKVVTSVGPGVINIELVKDLQDSSRNRGYAFVEYYNHACAEHSRREMSTKDFKLDSNAPTVSWAESKNTDSTSQVKAIYVKNLPKDITQDQLKDLFEHHGEITKVILPAAKAGKEKNRYGFVHFADRSAAKKAVSDTEKYELNGQVVECSLAKPPTEKKPEVSSNIQKPLLSTFPRGYGLVGSGYGLAAHYGLAPPVSQPMAYGRVPTPGVAMVPTVLPDGRLAYVLQQQPTQTTTQHRSGGNRSGGGGDSGSKQGSGDGRGRRYRPY